MRPVNKGESPYTTISKYAEALPFLKCRIGFYCSYCGFPIIHVPEVEHVVSKSKEPALSTKWENLMLGCKYCNTRKSDDIDLGNVDDYLWPDQYNTALAFRYDYGVPQINDAMLQQVDPSGDARSKAEKIYNLVKLGEQPGQKADRRTMQRNEVYETAKRAKERLDRNRAPDLMEQIIETAICSGFFSIWTNVFSEDPEMLNALILAFPGTEKDFFDAEGHPKEVLSRNG